MLLFSTYRGAPKYAAFRPTVRRGRARQTNRGTGLPWPAPGNQDRGSGRGDQRQETGLGGLFGRHVLFPWRQVRDSRHRRFGCWLVFSVIHWVEPADGEPLCPCIKFHRHQLGRLGLVVTTGPPFGMPLPAELLRCRRQGDECRSQAAKSWPRAALHPLYSDADTRCHGMFGFFPI